MPAPPPTPLPTEVIDAIRRVWGFDGLRPLQAETIHASLNRRDALLVLPTGGGKSLCYQAPPLVTGHATVVISPLIALMKDQVDALRLNGYPAVGVHSGCTPSELAETRRMLSAGEARLLFLSPERLFSEGVLDWLARLRQPSGDLGVQRFAIDEAHCISHWGHDFRPEYRRLAILKQRFPHACVHAFTATATEKVRDDIVQQLGLHEPVRLVGTFDRPNLVYRVIPRVNREKQVAEIVARHPGEATIVYCISRRDTEQLADWLRAQGVRARAYHAGFDADKRRKIQDAFAREKIDVVVATVAFGMGIDRSNVRCVIHGAMPKSIEAYQQETGRAGRDGLEAECVLLYSNADVARWSELMRQSASESETPPQVLSAQLRLLEEMQSYAGSMRCRHRALSEHFGQKYPFPNCNACDMCLDEVGAVAHADSIARNIVLCVREVSQYSGFSFGAAHIIDVLRGSRSARVSERGHNGVTSFGALRGVSKQSLGSYVNQLIDQRVLARGAGEFRTLELTEHSESVVQGDRVVTLFDPQKPVAPSASHAEVKLSPDERRLFESLRDLRRSIAEEAGVPPYVVFGDETLRELSAVRPGSTEAMLNVRGVGDRKVASFGPAFLAHIARWCEEHELVRDACAGSRQRSPRRAARGG